MTAPAKNGLPGLIAAIRSKLGGHDAWAIRLVFLAGAATILHKSGVPIPHYAVLFGVALGIAALLYEMNAATYALRSWWEGRIGGMLGWSFVWLIAFLYSMNQWMGAASENEAGKSGLHRAAYVAQVDTTKTEGELTAKAAALQQRIAMAPQRGPEAAQAAITRAQADRLWERTKGCTEAVRGTTTRPFCDGYASAVADLEAGKALIVDREELELTLSKLQDVRNRRSAGPAVVTETRNDLVILTRFAGMSEGDARVWSALGSIMTISIFLSLATALREMGHLRAAGPRTPLFSWGWLRTLVGFLTGREPTRHTIVREEIRERDTRFDQFIQGCRDAGLISATKA